MSIAATTGIFTQENLPSLLKKLLSSYHTGRLFLESGALRGLISFKDGSIIDATFGSQYGVSALISALQVHSGNYTFRQSAPSGRTSIEESLDEILARLGYSESSIAASPSAPAPRSPVSEDAVLVAQRFFHDLQQVLVTSLGPIAAVLAEDVTRQMGYQDRRLEQSRLNEFAALLIESVPSRKRSELETVIRRLVNQYQSN